VVDEGVPSYEDLNIIEESQADDDEDDQMNENPLAIKKNEDEFNGWNANLPPSYNVDEYNSEESKDRSRFTYKYEEQV
jgi:uncharacterized protein YeaO (DUF488 family)